MEIFENIIGCKQRRKLDFLQHTNIFVFRLSYPTINMHERAIYGRNQTIKSQMCVEKTSRILNYNFLNSEKGKNYELFKDVIKASESRFSGCR